jgi:hypothetical protein
MIVKKCGTKDREKRMQEETRKQKDGTDVKKAKLVKFFRSRNMQAVTSDYLSFYKNSSLNFVTLPHRFVSCLLDVVFQFC